MKPTLVIGASEKPERYSNKAINMLLDYGHMVYGFANKRGNIRGVEFMTSMDRVEVDTVTMYVSERYQSEELKDYIQSLNPKRVIFNPGTENLNFANQLRERGVETEEACTLVLLNTGQF